MAFIFLAIKGQELNSCLHSNSESAPSELQSEIACSHFGDDTVIFQWFYHLDIHSNLLIYLKKKKKLGLHTLK